ncbi:MAG: hypothetical protein JWM57_3207 [Phycisphaerales bacterium]|nr:hypothetical protein [Phycisphaerales bacterium]
MNWVLVQKDLRLLRLAMLAAVGIALTFYVVVASITFVSWQKGQIREESRINRIYHREIQHDSSDNSRRLALFVADNCTPVSILYVVLIAAVGAMAFARERRDRSAEFLAMLPVSIRRQSAIKLVVSVAVSVLPLAVNAMVFLIASLWFARAYWGAMPVYGYLQVQAGPFGWRAVAVIVSVGLVAWIALRWLGWPWRLIVAATVLAALLTVDVVGVAWWTGSQSAGVWFNPRDWRPAAITAVFAYVGVVSSIFGLAWLLSSATRSSVLSAVFGLGLPLFAMTAVNETTRRADEASILRATGIAGVAVGALCVAAGCVVQSKRPTP